MLHGVDLEVDRAEMVAVVGSSGSGKSTLLHCLGLLDTPDIGEVRLLGKRIDNGPDRRRDTLRNRTFGFIFQFYHLLPELSALENVMLPHMIRHGVIRYYRERKQIRAEATRAARAGGPGPPACTTSRPNCPAARCSARRSPGPWSPTPRSCWPTSRRATSTPPLGQSILELLRDLNRERGLTMMMVTHDLAIAGQADRVVRLAEGRIEEWSPVLA